MIRTYHNMILVAGDYAAPFRRTLLYAVTAAILQAAGWIITLPLFSLLLSPGTLPIGEIVNWLLVLTALLVVEGFMRWREMAFVYDYWHRVTEALRLRLAERLRAMPLERLAQRKSGDLATILGNNVTFAATALSSLATLAIQLMVVPAVLLLLIFTLDWRLGVLLLAGCLLVLPMMLRVRREASQDFQRVDEADAAASAAIVEYVQGQAMLRASGRAGAQAPCLRQVFTHQHQVQHQTGGTAWLIGRAQLIIQLTLVATIALGIWLCASQQLPLASLLCLAVLVAQMVEPLTLGLAMVRLFELADAALVRVNALLAEAEQTTQLPAQLPGHFAIELQNLGFHYHQQIQPAIKDLTLRIPEKSLTALVGPSGGGKTTLTRLMSRFADPQQGSIQLGGAELRHISTEQLLAQISVVFQDVWLMDDTLFNNIALGKPHASEEEVINAARKAHIHHVIEKLPHGYSTCVGEAGSALSGGERQRVAIARAILKDAPVVLLDEPTSSLDSESEYQVQQAINALVADKTVVIVAHRLSTIRAADQIAYVDRGRCVECGDHATLMALENGHYRALVQAQQGSEV
ncbi:ABC transporter ATP-binding protein [Nissabacter sp. SGAir0207]|uniref:ABC transporter ATP-binding protein n=1 Tax=Nissabacter sp. SGAir0207 TaxID=2126321 RepID=UPI0010CD655D|nr:ABC transporter ATP-binding protein [Nissabacter sp. SGAir0207]QCR38619.1 ABC transporter ATP-binding protein/permease [Nissabacter sp. SGAir0207]